MLVVSSNIVLSPAEAAFPDGTPWIGYQNVISTSLVSSGTQAVGFPATNLANPSTNLKWKSTVTTGVEYIFLFPTVTTELDYIGIAAHNFGSAGISVEVHRNQWNPTQQVVLLPFEDPNGTTAGTSEYGSFRIWTFHGNAKIDYGDRKFGHGSLLLDGTSDWIETPDAANLNLGSGDFTIDFWFNCTAASTGDYKDLCGTFTGVASQSGFYIARNPSDHIEAVAYIGSTSYAVISTTVFTSTVNPGWHHVAFVRAKGRFALYIDGVQEGTPVFGIGTINDSISGMGIGSINGSDRVANCWTGRIDEFRITVGVALYGNPIVVPGQNDAFTRMLIPFDAQDGVQGAYDIALGGGAHSFTFNGNAQIDTAQKEFGPSSLLLDGTGDWVSMPVNSDLNLGSGDFTIDFWFNCTEPHDATNNTFFAGCYTGVAATSSWLIYRQNGSDFITCFAWSGATLGSCGTNVAYTDVTNPGWHHLAFLRSNGVLKLFIDGVPASLTDQPLVGTINPMQVGLGIGSANEFDSGVSVYKGWIDQFRISVGVARWTSSFTPGLLDGDDSFTKILLHCNGNSGSTSFQDSSSGGALHTWTANGLAHVDTAQKKFGSGSMSLTTGAWVDTPDSADFTLGASDWTVDFWFNCTATGGTLQRIGGQIDSAATATTRSVQITRFTSNVITFAVGQGSSAISCAGTTQFTDTINPGWHHCACVRAGGFLKIFIDGRQEGTDVAISGSINDSSNKWAVGRLGEQAGLEWVGWIDEFRLSVGIARWTSNFTPPTQAYGAYQTLFTPDTSSSAVLVQETMPADNSPMILRFTPQVLTNSGVLVILRPSGVAPQAAVTYLGKLLVMERSIDVSPVHVPIPYGRQFKIASGLSESGNFLGRVVTQESRQSKAEFKWLTPDFYRSSIDPFLKVASTTPFFWAWYPTQYPAECGYAWMTNQPVPETDPVTQRVHLTLEFKGVT